MIDCACTLDINTMRFLGSCTGMVIRTGDTTVMGRIAALGKGRLFVCFVLFIFVFNSQWARY